MICLDPPTVRTAEGAVHATASDADLLEGKILAVLNPLYLQHRDLVDIFLYADKLRPDSPERLKEKIELLGIGHNTIRKRLKDLDDSADYHANAIQQVIDTQVETAVARQTTAGGGGRAVLSQTVAVLKRLCPT